MRTIYFSNVEDTLCLSTVGTLFVIRLWGHSLSFDSGDTLCLSTVGNTLCLSTVGDTLCLLTVGDTLCLSTIGNTIDLQIRCYFGIKIIID